MKKIMSGITVDFRYKKVKNMNIRLTSDGVFVSAPYGVPLETAEKFVLSKKDWIEKNLTEIKQKSPLKNEYKNGDTVYLCEKPYILKTVTAEKESAYISGGEIILCLKTENAETVKRALLNLYKTELIKRAKPIIEKTEEKTGLKSGELAVKNMKTRWGSCNTKTKKICLNLQLAKFGDGILTYIITHEILHIKYPNHGKEFKAALDFYCPDWKNLRKKLNKGEI